MLQACIGCTASHWHSSPAHCCHALVVHLLGSCSRLTFVCELLQRTAEPATERRQGGRLLQLRWPHQPGGYRKTSPLTGCPDTTTTWSVISCGNTWLRFSEVSKYVMLGCRHCGAPSRHTTPCSSTTRELAPPLVMLLHACTLCCIAARNGGPVCVAPAVAGVRGGEPQHAVVSLQGGPPAEDCWRGYVCHMGCPSAGGCIRTDLG
jgi:hypothetical protein